MHLGGGGVGPLLWWCRFLVGYVGSVPHFQTNIPKYSSSCSAHKPNINNHPVKQWMMCELLQYNLLLCAFWRCSALYNQDEQHYFLKELAERYKLEAHSTMCPFPPTPPHPGGSCWAAHVHCATKLACMQASQVHAIMSAYMQAEGLYIGLRTIFLHSASASVFFFLPLSICQSLLLTHRCFPYLSFNFPIIIPLSSFFVHNALFLLSIFFYHITPWGGAFSNIYILACK